jgi:UDP-N-acetylglucosamine:LPS N-acetylglucosamine transferase
MNATKKKILFVSGSLGLGHVTRDLAIAAELRKQNPDIEISWMAAPPASMVLKNAGEKLIPETDLYANYNVAAEQVAVKNELNLTKWTFRVMKTFIHNAFIIKKAARHGQFDLIIGDETYEVVIAMVFKLITLGVPFVMILDVLGVDAMSKNVLEKIGAYFLNWIWSLDRKIFSSKKNMALFVGEPDSIIDKRFGLLLPDRRLHAKMYYHFIGYVLLFDPVDYTDRSKIRARLGYGPEPLVICSIGGTAIGKTLLDLCGRAYPIIREKVPNLRMVLVCGPRLSADSLDIPPGPDVKQYVPDLYQHFAACDLAVVQCGSTSTLELMALERPFIYFPLEGHCEQELTVASRVARHRAGVRMSYSKTTPESLAREVISNLGKKVDYVPVPISGAAEAARLIIQKL